MRGSQVRILPGVHSRLIILRHQGRGGPMGSHKGPCDDNKSEVQTETKGGKTVRIIIKRCSRCGKKQSRS